MVSYNIVLFDFVHVWGTKLYRIFLWHIARYSRTMFKIVSYCGTQRIATISYCIVFCCIIHIHTYIRLLFCSELYLVLHFHSRKLEHRSLESVGLVTLGSDRVCQKTRNFAVSGGEEMCLRMLKTWVVWGYYCDSAAEHYDEVWKNVVKSWTSNTLPTLAQLDEGAVVEWSDVLGEEGALAAGPTSAAPSGSGASSSGLPSAGASSSGSRSVRPRLA
jgi:hypothetical protein